LDAKAFCARARASVERPIRYLRDSFLYGRTFLSDADLSAHELGPPNIAEPLVERDIKALSVGREARAVRTSRWIVEVDSQTRFATSRCN
jgi:hypothetical protein